MSSEIQNQGEDRRIELIASHIEEIIKLLGEDVTREGLVKTPVRAAKALAFITQGYHNDSEQILQSAMFTHEGSQVVIVKDIEFYSMCEHHILPFFGKVSIAYLPGKHIVGLSKLARLVNNCARKLQVQERLTREICTIVGKVLDCEGVMVICDAQHLCMKMRGVEKQESSTSTMEYTGRFLTDSQLRRDVLE
ncbi:MAG: GTP cyclohydrolase I FolE, partial [Muribaculaceae bacterium]|nr:GTP cyclohydrolase I FolE [Muribaculaceae bacterium]